MPLERIRASNVQEDDPRVILYFHSGGFCLGYSNVHRDLAARISKVSGIPVYAVDYRLAPENPYPAANDDCLNAYRWLIRKGYSPENIVLGGDSAGGWLALMTMLSLREACEPLPSAAFLLSPLVDLIYLDGETYQTRAKADPLNTREGIRLFADNFCPNHEKLKPLSPLLQSLTELPRLLIQVGGDEVILSDCLRLAERAKQDGVQVSLEIWDEMWHIFQGFAAMVPEAKKAINNIGEFIRL